MKGFSGLALLASAHAEVYFKDGMDNLDKWEQSAWKSDSEMGKFENKAGKWGDSDDKAMATTKDARFYGAAASFPEFSNEGKTLIAQYTAKYDKDVECGGGYVKIGPKQEDLTKFGDPTPYNIMFGPDKCGYTKRTHLIFSYKGKNVLKKTDLPYKQADEGLTTLYRLTLTPDSKAKVEIDGEEVYSGSLEDDWELLPPKEISDPDDKKPSDWVDDAMMDDPEDKKPEDWVEEKDKQIVDPEAKKPEDWDDEEDGEWEAPLKDNANYKGEWSAKKVSNPAYKGVWEPKKIANPEYAKDDALYKYASFGFIGFDLWQVKAGSFFDDVILTDDLAEADKLKEKWAKAVEVEKASKEVEDKKEADASAKSAEADKAADADKDESSLDDIEADKEDEDL